MAVEQLDDRDDLAQTLRPLDGTGRVDGVDDPDAAVGDERVRRARHRLVLHPGEAEGELLYVWGSGGHAYAPKPTRLPSRSVFT